MRIALDTFGPYELNTLGQVVLHLELYDDDEVLYVRLGDSLSTETPALVSDGSERASEIRDDLALGEWGYIDMAREMIGEVSAPIESEALLAQLVDRLNQL
jgi:hypothetical protein